MGCSGSKTVKVVASDADTPPSDSDNTGPPEVQVNVFDDSTNNNELGGSCYNAKPRLRSAIRRGDDDRIQPFISEENNGGCEYLGVSTSPCDIIDNSLICDTQYNRDSGFDSTRAISEASDWGRVSKEELVLKSGRQSHNSVVTTRSESTMAASVVTARDLNASFMTVSDDFMAPVNDDLTFETDTPLDELTDLEDLQPRTLSNTPSRSVKSVEPTPLSIYTKNIDVIKEESEGGFTPRSIFSPEDNPPLPVREEPWKRPVNGLSKYPSDEVLRHNQAVGWSEWGIYQGMVYETTKVIGVFSPLYKKQKEMTINKKNEERIRKANERSFDSDSDEEDWDFESEMIKTFEQVYPKKVLHPTSSLGRAIKILRESGVPMELISQNLPQCVIGEVEHNVMSRYFWNDFRKDVNKLLDDLVRDDLKDELTPNTKEVLGQLQRWIRKYRNQNPQPPPPPAGDLNVQQFTLPDEIQNNPQCLRQWVELWERFDLEVPESGAWSVCEIEDIDLGDSHEIFMATLRGHDIDDISPLVFTIDGEAAWEVMQTRLIADEVMTASQMRTEEFRRTRTDLHDPHRMERRREKLLRYFVERYELAEQKVRHFLQWAKTMEEGERRFQHLCGNI